MDESGAILPWFTNIFKNNALDFVSYIPMAVNSLRGTTSMLPEYFGNNYYGTDKKELQMDEIQIMPSTEYWAISDSCDYYYYRSVTGGLKQQYVGGIKWGDMRSCTSITLGTFISRAVSSVHSQYGRMVLQKLCLIPLVLISQTILAKCFRQHIHSSQTRIARCSLLHLHQ